jgi:hypothetical protein
MECNEKELLVGIKANACGLAKLRDFTVIITKYSEPISNKHFCAYNIKQPFFIKNLGWRIYIKWHVDMGHFDI